MKTNLFCSFQLLVISAVFPLLTHSQTKKICDNEPTPAGWVTIAIGKKCALSGLDTIYSRTIQKIDGMATGSILQICGGDPTPAGWITIATGDTCARAGSAVFYLRTIEKIDGMPAGSILKICGAEPTPSGWITIAIGNKCATAGDTAYYERTIQNITCVPVGTILQICGPDPTPKGWKKTATGGACARAGNITYTLRTIVRITADPNAKTFYQDADGDGYGNVFKSIQACSALTGYIVDSTDCNDSSNSVHPGAIEVLNGVDDNCNGQIDEGLTKTFYRDADGDGFGNPAISIQAVSAPPGYVTDNTDCNDGPDSGGIHPGAPEICDGIDNNCDGQIDEGVQLVFYHDADQDGYGNRSDTIHACSARTGYVNDSTDCDDSATGGGIHPGAPEICDGIDNNCNGQNDEGVQLVFYRDADQDGYGLKRIGKDLDFAIQVA